MDRKKGHGKRGEQRLMKILFLMVFSLIPVLASAQQQTIKGVVIDGDMKETLPGVTVQAGKVGTVTDMDGQFSISAAVGSVIKFSFMGFKTQEYKVTGKEGLLKITLVTDVQALSEVVIEAGIMKRDKLGFTGAYTAISKDELKSIGNTNLVQSLKSLDPAFVIVENSLAGSNPNAMANIEVRGQTSMNITSVQDEASAASAGVTSNLPLFILDGFEASLQEINDLDVNRVESITILKDAGSTAIYGSKGANGVIVIETIRPTNGQIFITYNGDFEVAAPDLSVYNMMNAAEKLEFERLAGRYDYPIDPNDKYDVSIPALGQSGRGEEQASYYERLARVQSGVNTYWLSEPVRTAFSQTHSVTISGGEKSLLFSAGVNYKSIQGVMKGSGRDTYGGNIKLVYKGVEGLNIQNNIMISGTNAADGSWGKFSDFINANPYYTKTNADGTIPKYLDRNGDNIVAVNPLYNALLNTRHDDKIFSVTNNTAIDWTITQDLLMRANLSLKHNSNNQVDFMDPSHSKFDNDPYNKKGTYQNTNISGWSYNANVSLNYLKSVEKHNFTFIGRYNIEETNNTNEAYIAEGFPEGAVGYPSYAFSYQQNQRPLYTEKMTRALGVVGAFNYNYNYRYLLDLNYNMDGSTSFGKNKRYQSFWSVGAGWNVHRETFAKDWEWLSELKLRGTIGTNGTQAVNVITSSVYSFYVGSNAFGQSAYLSAMGNLDLRWQIVEKKGAGLDAGFLKNHLRINFDVFENTTDPQVIVLDQRLSTGVKNFPLNLGFMKTKGYEFKIFYNLVNKDDLSVSLRLTGGHTKSTYGGFADALNGLNAAYQQGENSQVSLFSLQHYLDGNSPSDLWAVRSAGIDPATGREVFLTKDGIPTYIYNPDDRVVIANTRPDIEGIFGFTVRYKKLMVNANLRYSEGAYSYNTALFNKVENISANEVVYNQDKRALYERWRKAGDVTEFKKIQIGITDEDRTPVSSRFIQKNNYIKGESAKATWNFTGDKWLEAVKLKDFSLSVSMQDFFSLNSTKLERGTDYPFQRSVVLNLSARF